jgi:hypothetical protein
MSEKQIKCKYCGKKMNKTEFELNNGYCGKCKDVLDWKKVLGDFKDLKK